MPSNSHPRDRIDPESREPLEQLLQAIPGGFQAIADIEARRAAVRSILAAVTADIEPNPQVLVTNQTIPGRLDGDQVAVRIYRPKDVIEPTAGLLYIHGGGMILGDLEGEHLTAEMLCAELGITIMSTDYRKAPEHRHPAQVHDCFAALTWMAEHADNLGIDQSRMGIYGGSAGGNLCLATAFMSLDHNGPELKFIMPIYPMLDASHSTSSNHEFTDIGIWDRSGNIEAWEWFLGGQEPDAYASPKLREDLSGLPPLYTDVGELDLFRDEDIEFVSRLLTAGVPAECHVFPGAYHASETFAPSAALSQRIWKLRLDALRRGLIGS